MSEAPKPKRTDVGHGRPPKEHQFKPKQSGNPNGRPRKDRPLTPRQFRRDLLAVAETMITLNTPDGPQRMTMVQGLIWQTANRAAKGHGPSLRYFLGLYQDALQDHSDAHSDHFDLLEAMERLMSLQPEKHRSASDRKMLSNARKRTRKP